MSHLINLLEQTLEILIQCLTLTMSLHLPQIVCSPFLIRQPLSPLNNEYLYSVNDSAEAILLQSLGVIDIAATAVPDNKLLANALLNVSQTNKDEGWVVKCSGDFVNEYPRVDECGTRFAGSSENPNHLLGSFPCLFPYGLGRFEVDRPSKVTYENHA